MPRWRATPTTVTRDTTANWSLRRSSKRLHRRLPASRDRPASPTRTQDRVSPRTKARTRSLRHQTRHRVTSKMLSPVRHNTKASPPARRPNRPRAVLKLRPGAQATARRKPTLPARMTPPRPAVTPRPDSAGKRTNWRPAAPTRVREKPLARPRSTRSAANSSSPRINGCGKFRMIPAACCGANS